MPNAEFHQHTERNDLKWVSLDNFKNKDELLVYIFRITDVMWHELGEAQYHLKTVAELLRNIDILSVYDLNKLNKKQYAK